MIAVVWQALFGATILATAGAIHYREDSAGNYLAAMAFVSSLVLALASTSVVVVTDGGTHTSQEYGITFLALANALVALGMLLKSVTGSHDSMTDEQFDLPSR